MMIDRLPHEWIEWMYGDGPWIIIPLQWSSLTVPQRAVTPTQTDWHTEAACEGDDVLHAFTFTAISSSEPRYFSSSFIPISPLSIHHVLLSPRFWWFLRSVLLFGFVFFFFFSCVSPIPSFYLSSFLLFFFPSFFIFCFSCFGFFMFFFLLFCSVVSLCHLFVSCHSVDILFWNLMLPFCPNAYCFCVNFESFPPFSGFLVDASSLKFSFRVWIDPLFSNFYPAYLVSSFSFCFKRAPSSELKPRILP